MNNLYESIKENLTEAEAYHYIDSSEMENSGVYNSMANTDVIMMLKELKRYFEESAEFCTDLLKNATSDPGIGKEDIAMCKFNAEKCQEMLDKMNEAWQ